MRFLCARVFGCIGLLAVTISCGVGPPDAPVGDIEPHELTRSSAPAGTSGPVQGEAYMRFMRPLSGVNSREHFVLDFDAFPADAEATLHSHFTGFEYRDGVELSLAREGKNLKASVSTPGFIARPLMEAPDVFAATDRLRLRVEIHDGMRTSGVDIFLWNDLVNVSGATWQTLDRISEFNTIFSSRSQVFRSNGRGPYWGLYVKGAVLRGARREAPCVP